MGKRVYYMEKTASGKFQFAIDRGGTFTDVFACCPNGKIVVHKLLSEYPAHYKDAPTEGIRRILQQETGKAVNSNGLVDNSQIEWVRMGTTVATNALLERKGESMGFITNLNFKDILFIGNQARPKIFDLEIQRPELLYKAVIEADCRIIPELPDRCKMGSLIESCRKIEGNTGETFIVIKELDEKDLRNKLQKLKNSGIKSVAVALAHSYAVSEHELQIGKIATELGFEHVSLSHQIMAMVRLVPRGFTACADAYLTPHIKRYLKGFTSGFKNELNGTNVLFMQSDGGLTSMESFNGSRAVLSGPAGGVVGYALTTWQKETDLPVIGFDMGGTSTDVSRFAGHYEHVYESTTAGITIQAPQLDVNTVAAGGGSMLFYRSGLFVVGPESAGAFPGPACYGKTGPLAVTDANLVLGRLLPDFFPKIFGKDEKQPLDFKASFSAFERLAAEINKDEKKNLSVEEVALGFVTVANEAMCRPIRALTQAKGHDVSQHALACFGGAGGQHACAIAIALGMKTVLIHKFAGILSAYGIALADVVKEMQEPCAKNYTKAEFAYLEERLDQLGHGCTEALMKQGFVNEHIQLEYYLHLRYDGTDFGLMCKANESKPGTKFGDFMDTFLNRYKTEFGFTLEKRDVIVDDVRVRGIGKSMIVKEQPVSESTVAPVAKLRHKAFFEEGYLDTDIFMMEELKPGQKIKGPAIVMNDLSTIVILPDCTALVTKFCDLKISIGDGQHQQIGTDLNNIQLSIFGHRFMSIAEQMGRVLQRTALSTNIKERLDFSCALFGPDGGLVSNAPHIPVHLGSMQEAVKFQIRNRNISEGDVILSNHPKAGGAHLPDFTVITPVFHKGNSKPIFFVASRGHHSDIGGITPGSMPPHSKSLKDEGAAFVSFLLVENNVFQEEPFLDVLKKAGGRNLLDNLSDVRAQVAANQKGIQLVSDLINKYSLQVVQAYMGHIQANAELAVRDMLKTIAKETKKNRNTNILQATDMMDDGSPICLKVTLDEKEGSAICDFTGTGMEVHGNCNAPKAITFSALIYCLRCMVGHDVPLNQGCLAPIKVIVPEHSFLDPSEGAAVVGGNVTTSQRVVDVILKAFGACAASQGCMNSLTFGDEHWGNYETVAGGSGAGPTWHGISGVHTHMTNTRITDIEIIERRFPVYLRKFMLRPNSGGKGEYNGGDGVVRELCFRAPITVSILSERRVTAPYGLKGGESGKRGLNLVELLDGRKINLGPKNTINLKPGEVFILETPGGGGYGNPKDGGLSINKSTNKKSKFEERGSLKDFQAAQDGV